MNNINPNATHFAFNVGLDRVLFISIPELLFWEFPS